MARIPDPRPPMTHEGAIEMLAARCADLERRVRALETGSGRTLPGDYRFEVNGAGDTVIVRRVSTDGSAPIAGPL